MYHSKIVTSNQDGVHTRLLHYVDKHQQHSYQKPYQTHNLEAFEHFQLFRQERSDAPLILDSCCGTAMSTVHFAETYSDHLVIGIDQSDKRLSKHNITLPGNAILLRANCEDFWRLCIEHNIHFAMHAILYPNPYPKAEHLKRRWHGHPVFPILPLLAQKTVLRSNWKLYLEEFNVAWQHITGYTGSLDTIEPSQPPLTLFEKKYAGSEQALYELQLHPSAAQ